VMCGRYSLGKKPKELPQAQPFIPRFNIAPGQDALVMAQDRSMRGMRWGLVPRWAAEENGGHKLINARSETLSSKPAFKSSVVDRRCAVPADSFYEWRRDGALKRPFRFIIRGEEPFFFAAIWDRWKRMDGSTVESFSIITTEANDLVRAIHGRMPVILTEAAASKWLEPGLVDSILLKPFPSDGMECYAVSTRLNDPRHEDAQLIQREDIREALLPGFSLGE
jgi:putative SOS response-associated peptidase YedK